MQSRTISHPEDLAPLQELFDACSLADGHAPLGEHKYLDLVTGGGADTLGVVLEDSDSIIGYAHLTRNERSGVWGLEVAVHPGHRTAETVRAVAGPAVQAAGEMGGGEVHLWAYHRSIAEAVRGMGFEESRELRQLRRALPVSHEPAVPRGVEIRAFRPGLDEQAWLTVNNVAFADHPENGGWDLETLVGREQHEWFDPPGFRMAWINGRLAGFCWTKLHPGDVGEIYVIAVHPRHQGQGLGRALALDGLRYLHDVQGATTAMLYVDASNTAGLRLYEGLGFHLDHVDRCFVTRVPN